MGGDLPSADRLGEVAALLELDGLRALLDDHHRQRKRNKTLRALRGGLRVLILDGHDGRWEIENRGFNELVNEWHADHVYRRNPHAVVAILLPLFFFYNLYNLYHVCAARGLKPRLRDRYTTAHFAKPVAAEFYHALRH